jgi:GrpB-like predicted nucleotidyltransferase (UPF0157 family)
MLGLKKNLNCLVNYDPSWASAFIEERKRIADALGNLAKGIEHYGSTAVPGMRAKPILDILVGVSPFEDWAKCRAPLEELGYLRCECRRSGPPYIWARSRFHRTNTPSAHC